MPNTILKLSVCLLWLASLTAFTSTIAAASASSRPAHRDSAERLIRPGKSLGPCKLGAWTSTIAGLKSCEGHEGDAALGHFIYRYRASKSAPCDSLRVYSVRDQDGGLHELIEQVWTSSRRFVTPSGICVGDGLSQVKRAYPSIALVDGAGGPASLYDDRKDGIAFETRGTKCTAIIVHPSGKGVTEEYMHVWE